LLEQPEHRVERRDIPRPRAREESGRPEVARETRLGGEPLEELQALTRESDPEARLVVLAHQGPAVARRAGRDVPLVQQDHAEASPGKVERNTRPDATGAHDDDVGPLRRSRGRHRPDIESFLIGISINLHLRIRIYIDARFDKSLSRMTSDEAGVPDAWQIGLGEERARVAIVGCGGAGCNTLRHVTAPPNAVRIAMNDAPHPSMAEAAARILISATSLEGYASMDPKAVPQMETDEEKAIASGLLDRDIALIVGGLGGQLGGWGMSLVGRVARILGDGSVALATVPFTIEGPIRRQLAEAQLRLLQARADGVVTFSNDGLLRIARDLPLGKAFAALGGIMAKPAASLSRALGRADVGPLRRMLAGVRDWRFGMGTGRDLHRCFLAVEEAYASPWFTSLPEEISHAIVFVSVPEPGREVPEVLRQIRRRSPNAILAWADVSSPSADERASVQILAGT